MEESVTGSADTRALGQVLSQERERQGLARTDVAQRLHMSPSQVEALEAGDYERLPRGTFLRGFVRNYARVLHLDAQKLLPLLAEAAPTHKTASIVVPSEKIRFDPMGQRLANPYIKAAGLATVAVFLAFAGLYWWFFIRPTPPAIEVAKKPAAPVVVQGGPQQVAVAPIAPAETPAPTEAPREAVPPEAPAPQATDPKASPSKVAADPKASPSKVAADAKAAKSKAADASNAEAQKVASAESARVAAGPAAAPQPATRGEGDKKLAFRFAGESWVEIKDANGRTLMSKTNPAGTATEVFGRAPFTVVVGNAPEVQVTFDDRPLDLQPHSRVGVARLTVK